MINYENLNKKDIANLSTSTMDIFHLIYEFGNLHNIPDEITMFLVDDQVEETEGGACGIFQSYFYKGLFQPSENSKVLNDEKLTKNIQNY